MSGGGFVSRRTRAAVAVIGAVASVALLGGGASASRSATMRFAVLATGTTNDANWGEAWYQGVQLFQRNTGIKARWVGNINAPDQAENQAAALASAGYDVICICVGFAPDAETKLAKQFPKTTFITFYEQPPAKLKAQPPNTVWMNVKQQDSTFLAGVLAGLSTKTNVIGSVNGYAFPLLTRQPEGFALGARCVNPKVKFEQKYINSWTDIQLANSATTSMMADGADIILSAGDTDIQGMYTAAAKKPNTYVVSQYADSYSAAPKVVLTSALYGFDKVLNQLFTKALHHQLTPREQDVYTLKEVGGLAPFRQHAAFVGAANLKKVKQYQQWIASGKIRVPHDDNVIGKVGAGTKIDPKSIGC